MYFMTVNYKWKPLTLLSTKYKPKTKTTGWKYKLTRKAASLGDNEKLMDLSTVAHSTKNHRQNKFTMYPIHEFQITSYWKIW